MGAERFEEGGGGEDSVGILSKGILDGLALGH